MLFPPDEMSKKSTPCSYRMGASLHVSADFQEGSSLSSNHSVADILLQNSPESWNAETLNRGGGNLPQEERHVFGDDRPDSIDDFKCQPDTVFEATTILVCTVVADRAEERMQQVSVGVVDLNDVYTGFDSPDSRVCECFDYPCDAFFGELLWHGEHGRVSQRGWPPDIVRPSACLL